MSSAPKPAPPVDMLLLVSLYAAEFFLLVMALAIHRLGDRSLASSLGSTPGIGFVVALLAFLAAAAIIAHRYRLSRRLDSRSFVFTAAMNLITVALIFIPVEIAVRLLSRSLHPQTMAAVKLRRPVLREAPTARQLGGPGRAGATWIR
jgi:hypothetical protein